MSSGAPQLELRSGLTHYPGVKSVSTPETPNLKAFDMQLTVNGDIHEVPGPISLLGLIERFGLEPRKVAIERNLEIVPRSTYGQTQLGEGDQLEIVHFVGGG